MVVLVHANYYSIGAPDANAIIIAPFSSFWRIFAEQLCIVGVNIFVLISGWFGINPTIRGICSLFFQIVFWGLIIMAAGLFLNIPIPLRPSLKVLFFGSYYWFVPAYVGLFAFAPVLNSFILHSSPRQIRIILYSFFFIQAIFGWLTETGSYHAGYSFISFIGLYLLARYLNQYPNRFTSLPKRTYTFVYLAATLFPAIVSFYAIKYGFPNLSPIHYTSPFVILASLSLLLLFKRIEIKSSMINWIALSVFSVYIAHLHPVIDPIFRSFMVDLSEKMGTFSYTVSTLGIALTITVVCAAIDKIRITCWKGVYSGVLYRWEEQYNRHVRAIKTENH